MLKVIIASKNPVKIQAVKNGFKKMFKIKKFEFDSIKADSQIGDQPISDEQTLQGAINRIKSIEKNKADYWVGIEGGVEAKGKEMEAFAWVVVKDKLGKIGKGRTGTFYLPPQIISLIKQGKELGEADDIVFGIKNSKQKMGSVGILTHRIVDRTDYYTHAVIMALIKFVNEEFY